MAGDHTRDCEQRYHSCTCGHEAQLEADVAKLSEALTKAEAVIDLMADVVTYDITMQGPKIMGVNGSAARRASEAARFYLTDKEASILKAEGK
jgi:hypothetical protein